MATEIAQAYVQLIPSARGITGKIQAILNPEASAAGQSAGQSLGSSLVSVATKAIAAAGIGKAFSAAIHEGAALQQSLGGVETLFKGSADTVKKYAAEAYKTTGLSANAYMENVTGFSASLLQSLGGDTAKAADVANMAMVDMSDNANKMGTDMGRIQDAYQGFAKQNYTMLDNLKLGYGGTKSEMERLLADAEKLTGVKYDINNLSDVYNAIHAIQENLDITGTTAKEAASTFSGSFAAMKAAAQNVLGNLALGQNIGPSLRALYDTTKTFIVDNFLPMIGNVLSGLPQVIGFALEEGLSAVFGDYIAQSIMEELYDVFEKIGGVASTLYDMIFGSLSKKDNINFLTQLGIDEKTAASIVNIGENIRVAFENIGATIGNIAGIVGSFIGDLLGIAGSEQGVNLLGSAFEAVTGFIRGAAEKLKAFTGWLKDSPMALDGLKTVLAGLLGGFLAFKVVATVKAIITGFGAALTAVKVAASGLFAVISANPIGALIVAISALVAGLVWFFTQTELGKKIWSGFVDWIVGAWQGIAEFFSGLWSGISEGANNLWSGVSEAWSSTVEYLKNLWNGIGEFFSALWLALETAASIAWNQFTTTIMSIVQPFIDGFLNLWNGISDGLSQVWEGIKMIFQGAWEIIKSIVLGAILIIFDLVTGNFDQLGADLGLIWDGIKNGVSLIWEGIKTYFSGVVDAIVGYGKAVFENFATSLIAIWEFLKSAASSVWEFIKSVVTGLITGLVQGAQNIWNGFVSFLSGLWESIKSAAINGWNALKSGVLAIINGFIQGAQQAWDSLTQGVTNVVNKVTNIFDGLANINLWDAGKAILDGFLGGLKSAWDGVTNFVGGIAGWIRDHKGPIEYDRKLLIPAGKAIMGGLDEGLKDKFKAVKKTVSGMAGSIADSFEDEILAPDFGVLENREVQVAMTSGRLSDQVLETAYDRDRESLIDTIAKLANRPIIVSNQVDTREVSQILAEPISEEQEKRQAILNAVNGLGWT